MSLIKIRNLSIEFPGVKALDGVSFDIEEGKMMALCGENGAGKSTLAKIISGVHSRDVYNGKIYCEDEELDFYSTLDAEQSGIALIHQELNLLNEMTVAENIFLNNLPHKHGILEFDELNMKAQELLEQFGLTFDPRTKVKDLTVSKMQIIEIVKAIAKKPKVLIFDEATSSLTDNEVSTLFSIINILKEQGTTMIYVSHKLSEVFEVCDTISILKDGCYVKTVNTANVIEDDIVKWMVGREINNMYPDKTNQIDEQDNVLKIEDWYMYHPQNPNEKILDNISFDLKKGEILGIYGLVGAGRTELVRSIFEGKENLISGKLFLSNKEVQIKHPAHAIKHRLALITEDRKETGLVLGLSVSDNASMASLKSNSNKLGIINQEKEGKSVSSIVKSLRVKVPSVKHKVYQLSGGNQQKVVLGKWLLTNPNILMLDEPTRGIDVGAKAEIYKIMQNLANEGVSIIMVSSELPEILGVSDRILVMKEGKITADVPIEKANEESLAHYATTGGVSVGG